ncbi:MAG: response regulator transcription factor [Bacteroidetes bacterium]|jgi:two-component system LytT family response regulator|nr:response regulator transcription factor [Bacteroidota bacterium]
MMKAIIVDDEKSGRETLQRLLEENCKSVQVIGQADSVDTAETLIGKLQPDLIFLDVEMPRGSGFELLKRFERPSFKTIFVTAHQHYAIKAIRFSAADYLLKPVDVDELIAAVEHVESKTNDNSEQYAQIVRSIDERKTDKLAVPVKDGLSFIPVEEIIRLQADGSYTHIFTAKDKYTASRNIKEYEELLQDQQFFRAHHSHIINLRFVRHFSRTEGYFVTMSDGSVVEVSRRKKELFLQLMHA